MSRWLTPPKISLLVLIDLYCDSVVPSSATIPILSFITSHIIPPPQSNTRTRHPSESSNFFIPIEDFVNVTITQASCIPGRTLLDLFLKKLWSINSHDALEGFFEGLGDLLVRTREQAEEEAEAGTGPPADRILLARTSPLGLFVRRARAEFERLQFDSAVRLWMTFLKYKEPTAATWRKRNPAAEPLGFDVNLPELELAPGDPLFQAVYGRPEDMDETEGLISTDDVERILEFQVDKLQRLGNRVPDDIKSKFRSMIEPAVSVPSLSYFVKFFDAWRAGDYTSAFDNLHRYFDYTMQAQDRTHYQYALLHMAILHADFGCFNEAIAAMNETISTARENQDMSCLNFSLSWLHHLSKAYPKEMSGAGYMSMLGSESDALTFLKTKARDSKMYHLLSSTLLNEAKLGLSTGDNIPKSLEYIYQSSHLNIRENITGTFGAQLLMQSAAFGRLGNAHLSGVYCDLVTQVYDASCPMDEKLRATCRSSFMLSQAGRYTDALSLLESLDLDPSTRRVLKYHQYITACSGLIKLTRALRRGDPSEPPHLLRSLRPLCTSAADPDLLIRLRLLEVQHLTNLGHFSTALSKIHTLSESLRQQKADVYYRLEVLITKGQIFQAAGQAVKGLGLFLRAAREAGRVGCLVAGWQALAGALVALNDLGEFDTVTRVGAGALGPASESGDEHLIADLHAVVGDGYVGLAGRAADAEASADTQTPARDRGEDDDHERRRRRHHGRSRTLALLAKADVFVDVARDGFARVEALPRELEQLAKKALIARLRGDDDLAREWAENYLATRRGKGGEWLGGGDGGGEVGEVGN